MNRSLLYIDGLEDKKIKSLMLEAHDKIMMLLPQVVPVFKWKTAFFDYYGKYFCYLNIKKDHIYVSFLNMKEELFSHSFEIEHLKSVSKVHLKELDDIRSGAFDELVIQAAMIHEKKHRIKE